MSEPVTVVIAEDHPLFRKGLADVLNASPDFRIVGEAADGESALALVRRHRPRIALLDIELPKSSGLAVTEVVRRELPETEVVILTMYKDAALFRRALDVGAQGYVLKDSAATDIVACLHMVAAGRPYISSALSGDLLDRRAEHPVAELAAVSDLTPTERRILKQIAQGQTSAAIAAAAGISPKTVENHRLHICGKLGLHGPQALLRFALEHKALLD